jgi:3' exoribonuclease, RNase T-like
VKHCMVDIETLGTEPGCCILAIGAVMFDPLAGVLGKGFYHNLETASQKSTGLVTDPRTVRWWEDQSVAARARLLNPPPTDAGAVLKAFNRFLTQNDAVHMWGHGAAFDAPILRAAMKAFGMDPAWKFYDERDTRTIYDLSGVSPDRTKGVHHDALVDARRQAEAVCEAYASLGLTSHGFFTRLRLVINHQQTGFFYHNYEGDNA